MDDKKLALMKELGKISAEALERSKGLVRPGAGLLDAAESIEAFIKGRSCGLAFPINISVNEQAAHYTPRIGDNKVFGENDIVKVDLGAEKEGLLSDIAMTIDLSRSNQDLVDASREALENAISTVRAGAKVGEIGKVIGSTIEKRGFRPVRNLGGHGIDEEGLHTRLFIPNYDNGDDAGLEEDSVIAIEPFATTGRGAVTESSICEIYELVGEGQVRSLDARAVLKEIQERYSKNPFAVRWLSNVIDSRFRLYAAIQALLAAGMLEPYPVLVETGKGLVSQMEAQMIVRKDSCEILAMPGKL